jgi:hypothetical protein
MKLGGHFLPRLRPKPKQTLRVDTLRSFIIGKGKLTRKEAGEIKGLNLFRNIFKRTNVYPLLLQQFPPSEYVYPPIEKMPNAYPSTRVNSSSEPKLSRLNKIRRNVQKEKEKGENAKKKSNAKANDNANERPETHEQRERRRIRMQQVEAENRHRLEWTAFTKFGEYRKPRERVLREREEAKKRNNASR